MSGAAAVTVQHLVKKYGRLVAANDVSLSIHEGEIFGSIGPNGAGKTTTVECISRLRAPDSGSISAYGLSPQKDRNKIDNTDTSRASWIQTCASTLFSREHVEKAACHSMSG